MTRPAITQISKFEWEIPVSARTGMEVPVRIYATEKMIRAAGEDLSMEQAIHAASLPGLAGPVVVMPDVHQGYGFPIGGVAAMMYPDGMISPGAIGYDINCGVRLMTSFLPFKEVESRLETLATRLDQLCPSGVGTSGSLRVTKKDLEKICLLGSQYAKLHGMADDKDLEFTEEEGCLTGADPSGISQRAYERALEQLGTLGSGNHFIEVDVVAEVIEPASADLMGLVKGNLVVQIHSGSRGFGHQICTDAVHQFQSYCIQRNIQLPDRELVYAPIHSHEGQEYLSAMKCAANYAFCNRQVLAHQARRAFQEVFADYQTQAYLYQVYDLAHNIGKIESHNVHGRQIRTCVHRKGATRAFGPGMDDLPARYRSIGQPVLIPGSMGTASWVLPGTSAAMEKTYGSLCHGAGRILSRHQAKKEFKPDTLRTELSRQGIHLRYHSLNGLVEEAPRAYKNVDDVIEVVVGAGLARKVARLLPVLVIKG
jgi:tRNA-splicing ligase RtcB